MLDYGVIIMMYLLTQLAPATDNKSLTFIVSNETVGQRMTLNYDKEAKMCYLEKDGNVGVFYASKVSPVFTFNEDKILISSLIVDDTKINWKTVTSVNVPIRENMPQQSPIIIKRNKKSIILSQKNGDLANLKNVTISW